MYKNNCLHHRALTLIHAIALFLIAFGLLPMQANAADSTVPSWQGVWEGVIGKSKVTVCLAEKGKSAYRYQRYQTDIPLSPHGNEWEETVHGVVSGIWTLSEAQGDKFEGHWRNPTSQRTLPIRLKKTADANGSTPCESRAYQSGVSGEGLGANPSGTVTSANATNMNVTRTLRPEYAYVGNLGKFETNLRKYGNSTISVYHVNATTGALTPVASSPFKLDVDAIIRSITINPAGTFAYVVYEDKNLISVYHMKPSTGAFKQVTGSPFKLDAGGIPISIAINPANTFAYVVYENKNLISVYHINANTGTFTRIHGGSYAQRGTPKSVTINPAGTFAYVVNEDEALISETHSYFTTVSTYRINATTGALSTVEGNPFVEERVSSFAINPAGTFAFTFLPAASQDSGTISVYRIKATTGALVEVTGSPFSVEAADAQDDQQTVTIDLTGRFAYVANEDEGTVSAYRINASTGALSPIVGSPFKTGGRPYSVTIDHTNTFAYVPNGGGDGYISAYRINQTTGALTEVKSSPFAAGSRPQSVTVVQP